ncbi:MAG: hypothetical protein A2W01_02875 [Candidatus Solincola sediminis]|nr:MAG: hypothetical protein A2W01_02875 [Candidatus Solincola sediminis]
MVNTLQEQSTDIYTEYVRDWKEKGGKVLGYACIATPVEVIEAAGILPYRIKAFGHPDTELGDAYLARFNCRFCRSSCSSGSTVLTISWTAFWKLMDATICAECSRTGST